MQYNTEIQRWKAALNGWAVDKGPCSKWQHEGILKLGRDLVAKGVQVKPASVRPGAGIRLHSLGRPFQRGFDIDCSDTFRVGLILIKWCKLTLNQLL
jgi:hypothetical protein